MPRRTDISSIMVIGSGPIVIGQAAEFDYSGTQACRVLREEEIPHDGADDRTQDVAGQCRPEVAAGKRNADFGACPGAKRPAGADHVAFNGIGCDKGNPPFFGVLRNDAFHMGIVKIAARPAEPNGG